MTNFIIDVESDGPWPGESMYSMVCFGIVEVREDGEPGKAFYGTTRPISDRWIPEALAISGFTREEHLNFADPAATMRDAHSWLEQWDSITFWSDNIAYDWLFWAWYSGRFCDYNPAGFSARRISDFYCGLKRNSRARWKHLRQTEHTHNPVDDCRGNAEALHTMVIESDSRFAW